MANYYNYTQETPKHALYMQRYLVSKCENCKGPLCINYHHDQTPRRTPIQFANGQWNYRPSRCNRENCIYKESCRFAHTMEEVDYHPLKYKTKACDNKNINHSFIEPELCSYAHGDLRQVKIQEKLSLWNLDSFKVSQCTFTQIHNFPTCERYHQQNDKRRDPSIYTYSPVLCENLECKNDFCQFSHNQTEIDYHPQVFKTIQCSEEPCRLESFCPFLHVKEINEIQRQVEEREIRDLKEKIELMKKFMEAEEIKVKELAQFMCYLCNDRPGEAALQCGHLACEECSVSDFCEVCQQKGNKIYVSNI